MKTGPITEIQRQAALKRAIQSVLKCLEAGRRSHAGKRTREFFQKYGTNSERRGFADFVAAVHTHSNPDVSKHSSYIELSAYAGGIAWCQTRRNRVILEEHALLGDDLSYRLGQLLPPPKFAKGDRVDTYYSSEKGMVVKVIWNINNPLWIFNTGYKYGLVGSGGEKVDRFERELKLAGVMEGVLENI